MFESKRYNLLKIPFVSKKTANELTEGAFSNNSKYSFEGNAYYIVDTSSMCIIWERAILTRFEYRPTDLKMLKPTSHFIEITKKGFKREEVFPKSENEIELANKKQIDIVNDFSFRKLSTVLGIEGLITGSNSSGADKNPVSSPIIFDPRIGVDYIRFVNAIKRVRCHDKTFSKVISENFNSIEEVADKFSEIDIETFKKLNKKFSDWIGIINSDIEGAEKDDIISYIDDINKQLQYKSIDYLLALSEKKLIDNTKLVQKLRREFRISLLKEAKELNIPEYTGKEIDLFDSEAAHIVDVATIVKENLDYKWISDPNNGLLLEPTIHTILDKKKITIDTDGYIKAIDESYKHLNNIKIMEVILNKERINFINIKKNKQ